MKLYQSSTAWLLKLMVISITLELLFIQTTWAQRYSESPELAALVSNKLLAPVDQRLPKTPLLVQPVERIGSYGGQWRMAILDQKDTGILYRTINYENLVHWNPSWTRIVPNLAERYTVSADSRQYTFYLRKGVRWSDGAPFTVADIQFWFECEFNPSDYWFGKEFMVTSLDEYTVRFDFQEPNGYVLDYLASPYAWAITSMPRHYLSRFFPKYNPKAEAEAKAEGLASWWEKREQEMSMWHPYRFLAGKPVLAAWLFTNPPPVKSVQNMSQSAIFRATRNPYYWKIDPAGQQLPYLDQVTFHTVSKADDVITMALAGQIDMQYFYLSGEEHRKTFETMADQGKCRLFRRPLSISSASAICLNLTHKDPVLRRLFSFRDFREALSLAINRKQMIDTIGLGMTEPYQIAPRPESPFYHDTLARQHTEYNPAKARQLLEGMPQCNRFDSSKCRLREDGKRLSICLSISENPYYNRLWQEVAKEVAKYWQDIGIEVKIESLSMSDFYNKKNKNNHDIVIWEGEGGLDPVLEARYYLPISWESNYGVEWNEWRNHPSQYPTPPPAVIKQYDLFTQFKRQITLERQKEVMHQILDIAADQYYAIGIALQAPSFGFVHARFKNVPKIIPGAWSYPSPGPTLPCQYFVESTSTETPTK